MRAHRNHRRNGWFLPCNSAMTIRALRHIGAAAVKKGSVLREERHYFGTDTTLPLSGSAAVAGASLSGRPEQTSRRAKWAWKESVTQTTTISTEITGNEANGTEARSARAAVAPAQSAAARGRRVSGHNSSTRGSPTRGGWAGVDLKHLIRRLNTDRERVPVLKYSKSNGIVMGAVLRLVGPCQRNQRDDAAAV